MRKGILRRFLLLAVSAALCAGAFACSSGDDTTDAEGTGAPDAGVPVFDVSSRLTLTRTPAQTTPLPDPTVYELNGQTIGDGSFSLAEATLNGQSVTLNAYTVSAVNIYKKFGEDAVSYLECDVSSGSGGSDWSTLYFAFRLSDTVDDATSQSGIWIAVKNKRLGMRMGNWPQTRYFTTDIDFSQQRRIYFEDDPVANELRIFANDDSGVKTRLAVVRVEEDEIRMYREGKETPAVRDKIKESVNTNGFMRIWAHHSETDVTVSNLKISGIPHIPKATDTSDVLLSRDVFADTWVSTDDLGRTTITGVSEEGVSAQKTGIFYFLWHDGSGELYDHSASYYSGGAEELKKVMTQGPLGFAHYWAQPYFGYYRSDDEWIIRKHAYMLTEAGIDFVFFDVTNGVTYPNVYEKILKVWNEMRMEGQQTPDIMFNTGNTPDLSRASLTAVWNNIYSAGRYRDFWVMWEGKPLILAEKTMFNKLPDEMRDTFTARASWAHTSDSWYTTSRGYGAWPWADMYPQKPGISPTGTAEQMIVMCGFWANSTTNNAGRSFSGGKQPVNESPEDFGFSYTYKTSGLGLAYQEQFDRAIETDPPVVMITGWNEWWAGRWEAGAAIGQTMANSYTITADGPLTKHYYVDCFNPEYSRDIEPVSGLFRDNYFYQTVQNIRDLKGARGIPAAFGQKAIDISSGYEQWFSVGPEYRDTVGDITHRNSVSYVGGFTYTNETGRNDFVYAKVSADGENVYFYAECASDITAASGTNWMNLFIDSDCSSQTGWYGYDYIINRSQNGAKVSVERFVGNEWVTESVGEADYTVSGKYIQIKVAKALVPLGDAFDFKWADNSVSDGDIMQFMDLGDTAPNDRFNYRYTTTAPAAQRPASLSDDMIVLKAGSYNAYVGGKTVMLDSSNTNAVALGVDDKIYLPLLFVRDTLNVSVDGLEAMGHYGVAYVMASDAIRASGKVITIDENGLIVISSAEITDTNTLLSIYRTLL